MLVLTVVFPILLTIYGNPDRGGIIGGYVGAVLFGAAAVAIGVLTSSLTANQIVAAVLSIAILLVLWAIDGIGQLLGGSVSSMARYMAMFSHLTDMPRGVINSQDIVYFISVTAVALFLATRAIEARRWR
jgi:ABC-2 type transport system permease protein